MSITIKRLETDSEIKGKAYAHWKSWQETYPGLVDQSFLDALTLEELESIAYRWIDDTLIAKDGERVVGFVNYGKYRGDDLPNSGEVFAIYVLADHYGQGIGYRLMQSAIAELKDYPQIAVWVLDGNERAIRFYERCGFHFDGRKQIITLGTEAIELRMVLEQ